MFDDNKEINPHGCGIGLTVSKKYIEKLGGSIWIESEYEKYTKVVFRIPFITESSYLHFSNDSDDELDFSNSINIESNFQMNFLYIEDDLSASKHKEWN